MYVAPALAHREGSRPGHHSFVVQVGFVAHYDQWDLRVVFNPDDLVSEFVKLGKGTEGGNGEDEEEALTGFHVELSHGS